MRQKIIATGFALVIDILLALVAMYFADQYNKWPAFFFTLAALVFGPAIFGFIGFLKFWLFYHVHMKRKLVRYYKARMHDAELPSSSGYLAHEDYFGHILKEDYDQRAKNRVSFLVGEYTAMKDLRPFTVGIAAQSALETAMEEYSPEPNYRLKGIRSEI